MAQDFTGQILANAPVVFSPNMQFPKVLACNCDCDDTPLVAPTVRTATFVYAAATQITAIRHTFNGTTINENLNADGSALIVSTNNSATVSALQKSLRALFGQYLQGSGGVDIDTTTTPGSLIISVSSVAAFVPVGIFVNGVSVAFV